MGVGPWPYAMIALRPMSPATLLTTTLVAAMPEPPAGAAASDREADVESTRRTGRILLGLTPVSFVAFAGAHAFGYGLRQGHIPCATPRNPQAALAFEAVLCVGLPGKVELLAAGAPMTLMAIGANSLTEVRLHEGHARWLRPSAVAAVVTGSVLIAGGFATVVLSVAVEPPVFRSGDGWGWSYRTHALVAQSGAALMAGGGALVGTGSAHLQATSGRRRVSVRAAPSWGAGPGVVFSGRF